MAEEQEIPTGAPAEAAPATPAAAPAATPAATAPTGGSKREERKDIFAEIEGANPEQPKIVKAKGSKNISSGIVHVTASFNNTKVSVTDLRGNVIGWSSSGKLGFKGSRKSTAYAAQLVSQDACRQAMGHGLREVEVRVKGPGAGRESAVRALQALGVEVTLIKDVTPIPHNGCRPPKARRV
jgi:small subunit ribosomal protein S11